MVEDKKSNLLGDIQHMGGQTGSLFRPNQHGNCYCPLLLQLFCYLLQVNNYLLRKVIFSVYIWNANSYSNFGKTFSDFTWGCFLPCAISDFLSI